ncbi:DUF4190 domain-containing protein [Kineococcus sp. NBC_00420]|uniref:DUF4190 domain-containing protein n=1 Tax=Kineococcus sp. NBC_00420 TaxID=2903564 RepID=UPI002E222728
MSSPYPAPPPYPSYPQQQPSALAVVSLVAGILSVVLAPVIGLLALGLGVAGIATGAITLAKRTPGRGLAIAGLVTGGVGALVGVVVTVVLFVVYGSFLLLGISGAFDQEWAEGEYDLAPQPYGDSAGTSVGEFGYGESAVLDQYVVSVDSVHTEGDVLYADLSAQYTGTDTGSAYYDLYGYLDSADGEEFSATDCGEAVSPDAYDLPDLAPGETVTFQVCFAGVEDPAGAAVEVVDGEGLGSYGSWSDALTPGGPSHTGV